MAFIRPVAHSTTSRTENLYRTSVTTVISRMLYLLTCYYRCCHLCCPACPFCGLPSGIAIKSSKLPPAPACYHFLCCCRSPVSAARLLKRGCCNADAATRMLQHGCCNAAAATQMLQHRCCNTAAATQMLQSWHYSMCQLLSIRWTMTFSSCDSRIHSGSEVRCSQTLSEKCAFPSTERVKNIMDG